MQFIKSKWFIGVSFLTIGIIIGSYVFSKFMAVFILDAYHSNLIAETVVDVSVLKKLHEGKIEDAINTLELRLDTNTTLLDESKADASKKTSNSINKVLLSAEQYKKEKNQRK